MGCGDGGYSLCISERVSYVTGVDTNTSEYWSKFIRSNLEFTVADATGLPFSDGQFDVVLVKDLLHHVTDPEKVLKEAKRVTKSGGYIIVVEANRYNPISYVHMTLIKGHQHFTKKFFYKLISSRFENATFVHFECRVFPFLQPFFHKLEDLVERAPVYRNILSYNAALIRVYDSEVP